MTAQLLERPKSETKLSMMHREHKDLLEHLAPGEKTRVICCAAKLINYFVRWQDWKKSLYPTEWVYQPLTVIRHDLLDEHSIHVIRQALTLLEGFSFLSKRKNDRATNCRNGQDRTHQYLLHSDRIELALEQLFNQSAAETLETLPFVSSEIPSVNVEIPSFTVEIHTQIPYSDSCSDSCSLLEVREKTEFLTKEDEQKEEEEDKKDIEQTSLAFSQGPTELLQQNKVTKLNNSSAPPRLKKQQNDLPTPEGWSEFYNQLLEYARIEGKLSPASWVATTSRHILTELAAGRPHCLWSDFQQGVPLGFQEIGGREWLNPETREPWPYFKEALIEHCQSEKGNLNKPRMAAAAEAADILSRPKKAAMLWIELKHKIIFYKSEWERQSALGVKTPCLPPYLSERVEPTLEEAANAMRELKGDDSQLQLLPSSAQQACQIEAEADEKRAAGLELSEESLTAEPSEPPPMNELQEKLNLRPCASLVRMLVNVNSHWGYRVDDELNLVLPAEGVPSLGYLQSLLDNAITSTKVRKLIEQNPDWGFLIDQDGQLGDF